MRFAYLNVSAKRLLTKYFGTFTKTASNTQSYNILSGPKLNMNDQSIAEMLMIQLNNNKGLFGIDCNSGEEYSYPKLKSDILPMASEFLNKGIGHRNIVTIVDFGSYESQVVLLAGLLVGATLAPLGHTNFYKFNNSVLQLCINEIKPDVLFCSKSSIRKISDILNASTHRPKLKISTTVYDGFTLYSNIIESTAHSFERPKKIDSKNYPSFILYSSGTTGRQKGVYLSDDAIKTSAISTKKSLMEEPIENRFMTTYPIFMNSGIIPLTIGIYYGKPRLFFSANPTPEQMLYSINKYKPTFFKTGVRKINELMYLQMANGHKYNIDCLKTVRVGGSPLRPELQMTITNNLLRGRIPIKQGYGSTEQGSITNWPMESDINTVENGSVGKAGYGIQIKITSLETDECLSSNSEGEIRIKSVSNMLGYVNDTEKTSNSYDEEGWYKSGDVGYYTDDGCIYIIGRIRELMFYNHKRIAPVDIETVLLSHPSVLDAGVTCKECTLGDLLIGVVKMKPNEYVDPDNLLSYVDERVEDYEKLRGGVIFVDEIPRTDTGKIKRTELKKLVQ